MQKLRRKKTRNSRGIDWNERGVPTNQKTSKSQILKEKEEGKIVCTINPIERRSEMVCSS
jgi:hypothetical protein